MILFNIFQCIIPCLTLTLIAGSMGRAILGRVMPESEARICLVPLQIGVGFVPIAFFLNVLLVLHLFSAAVTGLSALLLCTWLWKGCALIVRESFQYLCSSLHWSKHEWKRTIPLLLVLLMFIWGGVGLAAPSTGYDSTVYHLTLPKLYSAAGGYVPRPDIVQSRYPQNLAGIHTFAYQWGGGEDAVELFNMAVCALLIWLLVELTRFFQGGAKWGLWAIIVICSSFQFVFYLYDADVEGWLSFFALCLFACGWLMTGQSHQGLLVVMGALGGCLLGIKPTTAPLVSLALLFGLIRSRGFSGKIPWKATTSAILLCLLLGSFWYLIILKVYGHYYGAGIIGMKMSLFSGDRLNLSDLWISFQTLAAYNTPLLFYFLLIPMHPKNRMGREMLMVTLATCGAILLTNPFSFAFHRFTYFVFPMTVLVIVDVCRRFDTLGEWKRKVALAGVICFIIFPLLAAQCANIYRNSRKVPAAFRLESRDEYLAKRVNTYKVIQRANRLVLPVGKLFMVGERSFWLDVPFVLGIDRDFSISYQEQTPEKFFQLLRDLGVTHLLFSDEPSDFVSKFMKFWERYPELKDAPQLRMLCHDVWNGPDGNRSTYLYAFGGQ